MKRWPTITLGALTENTRPIQYGVLKPGPRQDGGVPMIRITDISSNYLDTTDLYRISNSLDEEFKRTRLNGGEVLISIQGTIGRVVLCPESLAGANISRTIALIQPDERVLPSFLRYCLLDKSYRGDHWTVGTTRASLNIGVLRKTPIPVPPLSEQERTVKLLDEADELRKLRAQADHRTTALIPALFHEMFGDTITNPKGWEVRLFSEVGKLDRGRSKNRPRDEPSLYGGKYPFIQTGDVANSNGEIIAYTQTYSERGLAQSRMWPAGTLVITIAANIGKTAILTFPACFPDSMVGFVPGDRVIVDYVRPWLVTMESRLEEAAPQMAQKNINLKILSELTIPVPPLALQKEFAQHVKEIRELEVGQATSRTRLDALFQSMLHRAFNGEL